MILSNKIITDIIQVQRLDTKNLIRGIKNKVIKLIQDISHL